MRSSVRVSCSLLALVLAGAASTPAAAKPRVQFELSGLVSSMSGGSNFVDGRPVGDVYASGPGFAVGFHHGLTERLTLAFRTGLFRDRKDLAPGDALSRWSDLAGYSSFRAASATGVERTLTSIPNHLLLSYRQRFAGRFGLYDEVGVGVTSFTEKVVYEGPSPMRLAAYQKNLSLLLAAGLTWDYANVVTLAGGVNVMLVPTEDGEVWAGGDNPQYVQFKLGILYPRR